MIRDTLAEWFCGNYYDCDGECDHGFGYRDADTLLSSEVFEQVWDEGFKHARFTYDMDLIGELADNPYHKRASQTKKGTE